MRARRPNLRLPLPSLRPGAFALALALAGCADGGGGGSSLGGGPSGAISGAGVAGGGGASGATQAHRQVALTAIGPSATVAGPVALETAALERWNALLARSWPEVRRLILEPRLEQALRAQVAGASSGSLSALGVRGLALDLAAPPGFEGSGAAPGLALAVHVPAGGAAWRASFTADVAYTTTASVAGIPIRAGFSADVAVDVHDVRLIQSLALDVSNPARPIVASAGTPQVSLAVDLTSRDPLVAQVLGALGRVLDSAIRLSIDQGAQQVRRQVTGSIVGPFTPWGLGAAPAAAVPGAAPLEPLAVAISDDIQRDHTPWGMVLAAVFDRPGYGNGTVTSYAGHGDSAIWTGHYLAGEAYRHDATGDPRALAAARRTLAAFLDNLEVAIPGGGLLSRSVIPTASPHYSAGAVRLAADAYTGTVRGQPWGGEGDISRDQYLGAFLGATTTYLRVPSLRPEAREMVSRMVDYLDGQGWNAYWVSRPQLSRASPLSQSPGVVLSFITAARLVDPARYGALHERYKEVSGVLWLAAWGSSREVHESYYKYNLGHAQVVLLGSADADPARYRDYVRDLEVLRDVVGHHDNAWFDAVAGMTVPAAAPLMGPRVRNALERWALRDRRAFTARNSQDPAIARVPYTVHSAVRGTWTEDVALLPVPIERRPETDFLWQRTPFKLDGAGDPRVQSPGVDLVLPYWAARAYGMVR
jgi:hypothetical protein